MVLHPGYLSALNPQAQTLPNPRAYVLHMVSSLSSSPLYSFLPAPLIPLCSSDTRLFFQRWTLRTQFSFPHLGYCSRSSLTFRTSSYVHMGLRSRPGLQDLFFRELRSFGSYLLSHLYSVALLIS